MELDSLGRIDITKMQPNLFQAWGIPRPTKPKTYRSKTTTVIDKVRITTVVITRVEPMCCYRCGRNSHFVANCYATFHLKGYELA